MSHMNFQAKNGNDDFWRNNSNSCSLRSQCYQMRLFFRYFQIRWIVCYIDYAWRKNVSPTSFSARDNLQTPLRIQWNLICFIHNYESVVECVFCQASLRAMSKECSKRRDERKMQRAYYLVNKYAMSLSVSSVFAIVTQKAKVLAKSDIRKFSEQSELDFIFLKKRCLRGLKM